MRVIHVTSRLDPRLGGVVTAVTGLALAQRAIGMDVSVLSTFKAGDDPQMVKHLHDRGVRTVMIGPAITPLVWHRDIAGVLRQQSADILHIHAIWEEVHHRAARVCQSQRRPYLIAPHGMLDPWCLRQSGTKKRLYLAWRLRRNLNRAAALHFTAETERKLTEPLRLTSRAIVEPNGLDMAEFAALPPRGLLRQRFPQLGDRRLVLFLSRIHPKKGLDLLIPAFARCGVKDAVLVLAGPAEAGYQVELQAMIHAEGLQDRVVFTGMLHGRQRLEALVDAEVFVLPSYQENFGIVVAEALACAVPVIISDQVNICDEVRAAGVGVVTPTQVAPLAETIGQWMNDEPRRRAAAALARPFVENRYDWLQIARRWAEHYRRLAEDDAP